MVKRLFTFSLVFVVVQLFIAQKMKRDENSLISVQIIKEDGTQADGKMSGIYFPNKDSYAGMVAQSSAKYSIYSTDVQFKFTDDKTGIQESIPFTDLKKIKVLDDFEDEIIGYEKLKIQQFDKDMKLVPKDYEAFLPIMYEGKINIYGYDVFMCPSEYSNCTYATTMFYIKNQSDPIAYMPTDYDRIGQLAWGSISTRYIAAFRKAGEKCNNFQKYIDYIELKVKENGFIKTIYGDWNAEMKMFRAGAKAKNLRGPAFAKAKQNLQQQLYLRSYVGLIQEYEKNCK